MRDPWAEDVEVVSSENVAFGVESAGLGSRFAASCIDLTIQALLLGLGGAFVAWSLEIIALDSWSPALKNIAQALMGLAAFAIIWGYYFVFEWKADGQTPGKRALGLRVLHVDGSPLTFWGALVRNVLRIFDFLPAFYTIGGAIALLGPNHRRAGDLVANTVVAREKHDATRQVLGIAQAAEAFLSSNQNASAPVPSTSVTLPSPSEQVEAEPEEGVNLETLAIRTRLKAADWEMALDFARRRETLTPPIRARLAARLAQQLAFKAGVEIGDEAEAFVLRVADEARQQSVRA